MFSNFWFLDQMDRKSRWQSKINRRNYNNRITREVILQTRPLAASISSSPSSTHSLGISSVALLHPPIWPLTRLITMMLGQPVVPFKTSLFPSNQASGRSFQITPQMDPCSRSIGPALELLWDPTMNLCIRWSRIRHSSTKSNIIWCTAVLNRVWQGMSAMDSSYPTAIHHRPNWRIKNLPSFWRWKKSLTTFKLSWMSCQHKYSRLQPQIGP